MKTHFRSHWRPYAFIVFALGLVTGLKIYCNGQYKYAIDLLEEDEEYEKTGQPIY